ncbi:MAG: hypothetical protein RBS40_16305 [Rhodocyclaceae bacterium]|jgi:hypothetical protein|nr:hypothetical protein [Rhodocyclaceae bacterium]
MSMNSFHARKPKAKPPEHPKGPGPAHSDPRPHHGLVRADALLVSQGLMPSRAAAQRAIAAGRVSWRCAAGFERVGKSSLQLPPDSVLVLARGDDGH